MIKFSQDRIDPQIELNACAMLDNKIDDIKTLIIGNAGCTLLSLISSKYISKLNEIDVVDIDENQLYLVQLKVSLFYELENETLYLSFVEGRMDKILMRLLFDNLVTLTNECRMFWLSNMNLIYEGINNVGEWDKLFRKLVKENNYNYKMTFTDEKIIEIFGKDFLKLSTKYSEHIKEIMFINKLLYEKPETNYFYNWILKGVYDINNDIPKYIKNYDNAKLLQINYHHNDVISYLLSLDFNKKYDLISLLDVTDNMDKETFEALLFILQAKLSDNGIVVLRRMTGNIILNQIINDFDFFEIIDCTMIDKSYFYKEIILLSHQKNLHKVK